MHFDGTIKWEKNYKTNYDLLTACPALTNVDITHKICMIADNQFLIWDIAQTPQLINESSALFPPDYVTYEQIGNQFYLKDNTLLTLLKKYKRLRVTNLENYNKNDILLPCTFNYPVNVLNSFDGEAIYLTCDEKFLELDVPSKEYKILGQISEPIIEAEILENENFVLLTNKAEIIMVNKKGEILGDLQTTPDTLNATMVNQIFVDENLAYLILDGSNIIAIDVFQ